MSVPHFRIGEECRIGECQAYPEMSWMDCKVIGGLKLRQCSNKEGYFQAVVPSYLIEIDGKQMCARPELLRKKFQRCDWGMLRGIWQPEHVRQREARRPTAWKEFK